jgi:thioredoxin-related protein
MAEMKPVLLMAALLLALLAAFSLAPAMADEVPWQDLPQALAQQKAQAKPIVIFFHLSYCWRCKEMKRKIYSDAEVMRRLRSQFIPVEVDMAKQEALGKKYGIDYIPTHVFLAPDGKEVLREKGIISLADYLLMLDYVAGKHYAKMDFAAYTKSRR